MANVYQTREAAIYGGIIDLLETRFDNAVTGFDVEAIARRVLRKDHGGLRNRRNPILGCRRIKRNNKPATPELTPH